MYHSALLEGVLDLLNLCRAEPARVPLGLSDVLAQTAARMCGALVRLCHPDGRIALFADAAFDIAPEPAVLVDYARRLGVPDLDGPAPGRAGSARLADSGYVRLAAGDWLLLASVAAPSPPHQPGHAHCDALAFELSLGPSRLVCDPGVFEYVPGERRRLSRATASHATLEIDGEEQAEIWAAHRVGGRPQVGVVAFGATHAEATCRGWAPGQPLHRRVFRVSADGVEIEDALEGSAREVCSRIPIGPDWSVALRRAQERWVATCRLEADGTSTAGPVSVEIELPAAFDWRIEPGPQYPSFGRERTRSVLVGTAPGGPIRAASVRFRAGPMIRQVGDPAAAGVLPSAHPTGNPGRIRADPLDSD